VDNLLSLGKVLAHDMGQRCAVDTLLDCETVMERTECEGMPFLTVSLPDLGKATEKWLDQGYVDPDDAPGFRFRRRTPIFMGKFYNLVFCPESGALLPEPSSDAIVALRQLCGLFGKMFLPASVEKEHAAMAQYISTDVEVGRWEDRKALPTGRALKRPVSEWDLERVSEETLAFSRLSMLLFHRVFDDVNRRVAEGELTPKHGPGSTADGLLGNEKFGADWTWRLDKFFPSDHYLLPNSRHFRVLDEIDYRDPEDELPVKVISVPKTQKTPRIIAMEPVCMQYAQQAVSSAIVEGLNEDKVLKRFLRLDRQEVNQLLAREGSITGALATLDLSEASDRVSNELVRFLTGRWEHLDGAIQACRSSHALVRLSEEEEFTLHLRKFASMGSALTFPLETLVFLTVVFVGIEASVGRRLSQRDIVAFAGKVAVYGDDIIVPTDHVGSVIHALEAFGFKVNSQKSFWSGSFRESCGKDYYDGTDVSYVKFRKQWPDDRQNVEEVIALVSFFNQCKDNHYDGTVNWLRKRLTDLLGGFFPRVTRDSAILGEWDDNYQDVDRLCSKTHVPLSKGWVVKDHIPLNPLDGERALLKFFLKQGEAPYDKDHLSRSGRSRAVSIKLCMAAT
jgi:hypothetical protein